MGEKVSGLNMDELSVAWGPSSVPVPGPVARSRIFLSGTLSGRA